MRVETFQSKIGFKKPLISKDQDLLARISVIVLDMRKLLLLLS